MKMKPQRSTQFFSTSAMAIPMLMGLFSPQTSIATNSLQPGFVRSQTKPAKRHGEPLAHRPAPYWRDGMAFLGVAPDEDDLFWGLDVNKNEIYVSGERGPSVGGDKMMFVAKFLTNGRNKLALDPSFGDGGVVNLDFSPYQGTPDDPNTTEDETDRAVESSRGLRVQSDGRIVIVGMAKDPGEANPDSSTPTKLILARLDCDGGLDDSFGSGGVTILNVGGSGTSGSEEGVAEEAPWGLEIDGHGRLLVSLSSSAESGSDRFDRDRYALRFTADGDLDSTWGEAGIVSFDVYEGHNDNQRHGLALPGGGLLSTGYTRLAGRNQIFLAQLTPDGAFDPSFSGDGRLRITPFPLGFAECYDAAQLSDGSFVTTGYGNLYAGEAPPTGVELPGTDAVQFHITADGSFDSEFGKHGAVAYNVNNSNERGRTLLALPDDTLVVGGTAIPGGRVEPGEPRNPEDAMLFVMDPEGRVRKDFDPNVHRLFDFGGADEEFFNMEQGVVRRGKHRRRRFIVASGYSRLGDRPNADGLLVVIPVPSRHRR